MGSENVLDEVQLFLDPWGAIYLSLHLVTPLFLLALGVAFLLAGVNALIMRASREEEETSFFVVLVSTSVFSLLGVIFGMMIQLVGGFSSLVSGESNDLISGLITMVLAFFGVGASLLSEARFLRSGKLDKPIASLAFLICFVVSGFFWKMLETLA